MRKAETHYQVLHVIMKRSLKSQEGLISECVTELSRRIQGKNNTAVNSETASLCEIDGLV